MIPAVDPERSQSQNVPNWQVILRFSCVSIEEARLKPASMMRLTKLISATVFFLSVPFLSFYDLSDPPNLIPFVVMFAAIAGYTFTEAFNPSSHGGNRLRIFGFRALFFFCLAVVIAGSYRTIELAFTAAGT